MTRKKFDIKDFENIGKNFSFEEAIQAYENLKKYFTRTTCNKLEIIFEGKFNDYRTGIEDIVLKCLEEMPCVFTASKMDEERFIIKIIFKYPISLEKVANICKELRQSLKEYESNSIDFNKKQKYVTYTFVKK